MKYNYYEVIVSYDEDQKLSVWWRKSTPKNTFSFLRLKEGKNEPEQTNEFEFFAHDSPKRFSWRKILTIIRWDYNFESSDMLTEAKRMIAKERAKTVSYFDFLLLRKEFDRLKEQIESRLKIED
jgi:hypothetical protein